MQSRWLAGDSDSAEARMSDAAGPVLLGALLSRPKLVESVKDADRLVAALRP
jgi:hypothetical protein